MTRMMIWYTFWCLQVSFAEYSLFYRALLQKWPIISHSDDSNNDMIHILMIWWQRMSVMTRIFLLHDSWHAKETYSSSECLWKVIWMCMKSDMNVWVVLIIRMCMKSNVNVWVVFVIRMCMKRYMNVWVVFIIRMCESCGSSECVWRVIYMCESYLIIRMCESYWSSECAWKVIWMCESN